MRLIVSWIIRASFAGVMELVDVPDSKSGAARRGGSSPPPGTTKARKQGFLPSSLFCFPFLAFVSFWHFLRGAAHELETDRHRRRRKCQKEIKAKKGKRQGILPSCF